MVDSTAGRRLHFLETRFSLRNSCNTTKTGFEQIFNRMALPPAYETIAAHSALLLLDFLREALRFFGFEASVSSPKYPKSSSRSCCSSRSASSASRDVSWLACSSSLLDPASLSSLGWRRLPRPRPRPDPRAPAAAGAAAFRFLPRPTLTAGEKATGGEDEEDEEDEEEEEEEEDEEDEEEEEDEEDADEEEGEDEEEEDDGEDEEDEEEEDEDEDEGAEAAEVEGMGVGMMLLRRPIQGVSLYWHCCQSPSSQALHMQATLRMATRPSSPRCRPAPKE